MSLSPDIDPDAMGCVEPQRSSSAAARARCSERAAATAFASSLLDPERPVPPGLTGPSGGAAVKRFAVYRNNVAVALVDALAATFPAVRRIVGERFFRAAARVHALQTPPTSPLMAEYGRDFPAFLEAGFEPARALPYLPDVARIERAWLDAYHAADAEPLDPAALAAVPPERLASVRFVPHPAARVVRSRFAAVSATAMNRSDAPIRPIDLAAPEDGLVARPALEVTLRTLPPGGAPFLRALFDDRTLGEAAALAIAGTPSFDLAINIGGALATGAFMGLVADAAARGERP